MVLQQTRSGWTYATAVHDFYSKSDPISIISTKINVGAGRSPLAPHTLVQMHIPCGETKESWAYLCRDIMLDNRRGPHMQQTDARPLRIIRCIHGVSLEIGIEPHLGKEAECVATSKRMKVAWDRDAMNSIFHKYAKFGARGTQVAFLWTDVR